MAAQGYVVKAETFYDMKLRKEGEIVAAGIDLAAVYPSFFRKPQTDEEKLAAKGIVADYEAALRKEKQKKADAAGFTFKVKAETFFKTLRKAGDLVKSAERLDLMYPAYFALIGVDAAADDGISGQTTAADDGISAQDAAADGGDEAGIADAGAEAEVIGEILTAAADDGISGQTTAADDGISAQDAAADGGDEAGIADAGAEAEVIGEILTATADADAIKAAEATANMTAETGSMIADRAENQSVTMSLQEGRASGKKANGKKANNA